MLDTYASTIDSNHTKDLVAKNPFEVVQSLARNLGLDRISNKKIKRFVVNMAVALAFLAGSDHKVDAQTTFGCVITNSNTTNVNIRAEPSINSRIEGSLSPEDVAEYEISDDGWHQIENGATKGWVWGDITQLVDCEHAEQMIEGLNDNSGVVLEPREYLEDNLIIFGHQDVLTDEQVLELNTLIDEMTGDNRTRTCDINKPRLIIFATLRQMYQLQRQLGRMEFHSFSGLVDYDGTTLSANNGYCSRNSHNAAVINIDQIPRFRNPRYVISNATVHEISHLYNTRDGARVIPQNTGLDLNNAYYYGTVAGTASDGRCSTYTTEDTVEFCNELEEVFEEQ